VSDGHALYIQVVALDKPPITELDSVAHYYIKFCN